MSFIVGQPQQSGLDNLLSGITQGATQGMSSALQKFYKNKQMDKTASALFPLLQESGLNIEKEGIGELLKGGADIKDILNLSSTFSKLKADERELQKYTQSLQPVSDDIDRSKATPGEGNKDAETFSGASTIKEDIPRKEAPFIEEEYSSPSDEKIKPILASQQIPLPTSKSQIQQHAQSRIQAKQQGFQQNKKLIQDIDSESKKAKEIRPIIKRSAQLAKSGDVGNLKGYLESKLGEKIKFFKSPSVAEFQRNQKELTVQNFRGDFGARPSQSEFFYISDVYSDAADTTEAIMRKLALEDWKSQIKEKRAEIKDRIFEKYGEYPLNINALIEEGLKPTYNKYLEKTGYNKWVKEQNKAKPVDDQVMLKYLRENDNDPKKALESLQKDNYKVIE